MTYKATIRLHCNVTRWQLDLELIFTAQTPVWTRENFKYWSGFRNRFVKWTLQLYWIHSSFESVEYKHSKFIPLHKIFHYDDWTLGWSFGRRNRSSIDIWARRQSIARRDIPSGTASSRDGKFVIFLEMSSKSTLIVFIYRIVFGVEKPWKAELNSKVLRWGLPGA